MKDRNFIILHSTIFFCLSNSNAFAQISSSTYPDSAYSSPSDACLSCPGTLWQNPENALHTQDYASTFLQDSGFCFQDNCCFSRELRFSNFGFNIPGDMGIDSFTVEIARESTEANTVIDSVVQLMINYAPAGDNYAGTDFWESSQTVFYHSGNVFPYWFVNDVNDPGFGLTLRVKNAANDTATAKVEYVRITVWYQIPEGIFSRTSISPAFNVSSNPATSQITINLGQSYTDVHLSIKNIMGQTISAEDFRNTASIITEIKGAAGLYFVEIDAGNGKVGVVKVVKE